ARPGVADLGRRQPGRHALIARRARATQCAVGLVGAVDAGLRTRAAGSDADLADVARVLDAGVTGGAVDAAGAAVADLVRAAGRTRRPLHVVIAHHRPGGAAGDAGEADVRVARAGLVRRARAAGAAAVADLIGATAGAGALVCAAVDAGHRPGRAGRRAVLALVRIGRARVADGAGDAGAGAVADPVGAAAGARGLVAAVDARLGAGRAGRRAVLADVRVGGARNPGRASDARAGAVADPVGAAAGARRLVAAVDARLRARRAGRRAGLADARVGGARGTGRARAA